MSLWNELPALAAAARRPLPVEDETIAALSESDRAGIATVWAERAASELHAAAAFSAVSKSLFAARAPEEISWLASRAVCDELRHAEICRYVASCYRGGPVARPALGPIVEPRLGGGAYAVLQGAINETIASAFLSACLDEASAPLVRAALRELYADETDHARIGWAVLGAAPPDCPTRREVAVRLPAFVRAARSAWQARAAELPEALPAGHGCLPRAALLHVVDCALEELVLPGFAHLGVDPAAAAAVLVSERQQRP
jgi:hypothetical protein